jgi:hypothetical protein
LGDYNFKLRLKIALIIVLVSPFFGADPSVSRQGQTKMLGVNRPGIAWVKSDQSWQNTIDDMAGQNVQALRLAMLPPFSHTLDIIQYAKSKGMQVLVIVPLTQNIYYPKDNVSREPSREFPEIRRLSRLDVEMVDKYWSDIFLECEKRKIYIDAIQVGNEINSAQFNGDLPILSSGRIVRAADGIDEQTWSDFKLGMRRVVESTLVIKKAITASDLKVRPKILSGSLVLQDENWISKSGNVTVDPSLALKLMLGYNVGEYVDIYSIHIYPYFKPFMNIDNFQEDVRRQIDGLMLPLLALTNDEKSWWVTEWGISSRVKTKPNVDRKSLYCRYLAALDKSGANSYVSATFIYDWDENPTFDIWDGRRVLNSEDSIFASGSGSNCSISP